MIQEFYREFPEKKKVIHKKNLKIELAKMDEMAEVIVTTGRIVHSKGNAILKNGNEIILRPYERCRHVNGWYEVECGMKNVTEGIGDHFKLNTILDRTFDGGMKIGHRVEEAKDGLKGSRTFNRWEPSQPVFISAQTGRGKNYFIENALLPYIRELNMEKETRQRVLILSNRIALTLQVKDRMKQGLLYQGENEESKIYSYTEYKNVLGAEYADVLSYQGFLNRLEGLRRAQGRYKNKKGNIKQMEEPKYLFVICDETHFFTSDSMFNPNTGKILQGITDVFRNAIRVYMTATPYECIGHITQHEKESYPGAMYDFKRDYSYLDIKYYSNIEELYDVIKGSGKENWLIFIDHIEKGRELKEDLEDEIESLRGKVYSVSAESKNDESYQRMVIDETINVVLKPKRTKKSTKGDAADADGNDDKEKKVKVLIATSVLDNGVNFRNIQNVVISDMSRVKVLQMVGRARVNMKEGDRVTLYVKRFSEKEVSSKIEYLEKRKNCNHDFVTSKSGTDTWFTKKYFLDDPDGSHKPRHWIGTESGNKMFLNEIAVQQVDTLLTDYKAILEEMKNETKENNEADSLPGQKYLERMLGWFGHKYVVKNDITLTDREESMTELFRFLEKYADNEIAISKDGEGESNRDKFRERFTELVDIAIPALNIENKNKRHYDISKANRILEEHNIGYRIDSRRVTTAGKKETYWTVIKP